MENSSDPSYLEKKYSPGFLSPAHRKFLNTDPERNDQTLASLTRDTIFEILQNGGEFADSIVNSISDFSEFLKKYSQAITLPSCHSKNTLLFLLMMSLISLMNISCSIMYGPYYGKNDPGIQRKVEPHYQELRRKMLKTLLKDPRQREIKEKFLDMPDPEPSQDEIISQFIREGKIPAMMSLSGDQKEKIMGNFKYLISTASQERFLDLYSLFHNVRSTLGIMNYDRYSPEMLKEALKNYQNPEYNKDKPVVLCIISRDDRNVFAGIQPISVSTYRVEELTKGYKVILIETSDMKEIMHHILKLEKNGILKKGNLAGVLVGSHGNSFFMEAGIDKDNVTSLSMLNNYFDKNGKSFVVFSACLTADGGEVADNLASRATLVFSGRAKVVACVNSQLGIDFETDENGKIVTGSIELSGVPDYLIPFYDSTLVLDENKVIENQLMRLKKASLKFKFNISDHFIEKSLNAGISNIYMIAYLNKKNVSPEDFVSFLKKYRGIVLNIDVFRGITTSINSGYSVDQINEYIDIGVYSISEIHQLLALNITPKLASEYIELGVEHPTEMIYYHKKGKTPRLVAKIPENSRHSGIGRPLPFAPKSIPLPSSSIHRKHTHNKSKPNTYHKNFRRRGNR